MAATTRLSITPSSTSPSSFAARASSPPFTSSKCAVSWPHHRSPLRRSNSIRVFRPKTSTVSDDFGYDYDFYDRNDEAVSDRDWKTRPRPCKLYVCNLPRSCDLPELVEMFKPFGTVVFVEIFTNPETGISRGSGYVMLDSVESAKAAVAALDSSDVGGREMRVKFSIHMNPAAMSSTPVKCLMYESPHKLYVGNLAWTVQPEDLRERFRQFGNVMSARVLHDRKGGEKRVYGFLSFSSAKERDAAKSLNGEEFCGREMVVR